jgi:predicted TIM-barrel fold metal-dependent hydrolase
MPKITSVKQFGQFRCHVDRKTLDAFNKAIESANQAGMKVDFQTDIEQLLKKITRIVADTANERTGASHAA